MFRLLLKIVMPLWFIVDYKKKNNMLFVYLALAVYFLQIFVRIRSTEMYNKEVNKTYVVMDTVLFWVTFCTSLHAVSSLSINTHH